MDKLDGIINGELNKKDYLGNLILKEIEGLMNIQELIH